MTLEDPRFPSWEVLDSNELLNAEPWLTVTSQRVRLPDGRIVDDFYRVDMSEFAVMHVRATDGRLITLKQYRHGVGDVCLALPGGGVEKGEGPVDAAKRELLEETGYVAENWRSLGQFIVNGNQGCGRANFFVADGATRVAEPGSGDLETTDVILMTTEEVAAAVTRGEVKTITTVALIAMASNPDFGGETRDVSP